MSSTPTRGITAELFGKALSTELLARGWTAYRLARQTGMSERHLEDLVAGRGRAGPRRETVDKIAKALGVPSSRLTGNSHTRMVVPISSKAHDILFAASALHRQPVDHVLEEVVDRALNKLADDPRVAAILTVMNTDQAFDANST